MTNEVLQCCGIFSCSSQPVGASKKKVNTTRNTVEKHHSSTTFTSLTKNLQVCSSPDSASHLCCHPPSFMGSGLWMFITFLYIYLYIEIYIYIYIYGFSSRFTGKSIFHSSQAPVCWIFCRSQEEGEPLNHQEALTMQTQLCKIAFKKHLLFMA